MENYEVALLSDSQGALLVAKQITLGFQGSNLMAGITPNGNLIDINLTVDASQESVLRDGSVIKGQMKQMAVRGSELEKQLLTITDEEEKTALTAKMAIWKTFNTAVQTALTKAMKAQYALDNPITTTQA